MSKISTYSLADTPLQLSDRLIGTEAPRPQPTATPLATKNFSLGELLQLFSANFPAATLQAVLNAGNIATQNMFITGTIDVTLIKPTNIEDILGSQGTNFQFLSKATTGINWVNLPVDNLQAVLNAGNTATQNINLTGNITSTRIIPGNIQDYTTSIGTTGQVLTKSTSGIVWSNIPTSLTPGLNDVLLVGNTVYSDISIVYPDNGIFSTSYENGSAVFTNTGSGDYLIFGWSGIRYQTSTPSEFTEVGFITPSSNNIIQFPDASGTIALISNIPAAIALTTTGTSGAATLVGSTLNIPVYAGGSTYTFTSPLVDTAGVITINQSNTTTNGYLSSTDWNTFNGKQDTITLTTTGSGAATFISNVLNIPTPPTATFTSLTTTGSSGSSTLIAGVLNVPTYTLAGLGGQAVLSGTGIVKSTAGTISYINGTTAEYVRGDGSLATFPTITGGTVTSVGLSMPSAFTVSNSPITSSGTIAVTGAGTVSQYVRGDGTLANFPNSTGGGASVNYYLNGSISQGTFGGDTYYQMSKTPILGAGTNFIRTNGAGNGYIASFITDAGDPSFLNIPGGNWNLEFYFQSSASGGSPQFYGEIYKVSATNVFTLVASGSANPEGITNGTTVDQYFTSIPVPQTSLLITDRLAIRIYVITSGRTITLHTENGNLCEVLTTFTTGLTALNGLTSQVQYFAVGTSGTDFNISSATDTHTFNLPTASATNRGALSSADWTTFNNKQPAIGYTPLSSANNGLSLSGTIAQLGGTLLQNTSINGGSATGYNLTITNGNLFLDNGSGTGGARGNLVISNNRAVYWGSTSGNYISADSVSGGISYYAPLSTGKHFFYSSVQFSNYGSGTKTGTATYNLSVNSTGDIIETAIPPVIPTLTSGSVLFSNGTTIAQDNANFFWDDTNNRLGINTAAPETKLQVEDVTKVLTNNVAGVAQGTLSLASIDAQTANIGPSLVFGGTFIDSNPTKIAYAAITGRKENSVSGNADGYLSLLTWRSTGLTEAMRITANGDVGVGTQTPLLTAVGRGNITINGTSQSVLTLGIGGVWKGYLYSDGTNIDLSSAADLTFGPGGGVEKTRFTAAGDVGIGTSIPTTKLDVNGVITATGGNSTSWNAKQNALLDIASVQDNGIYSTFMNGAICYFLGGVGAATFNSLRISSATILSGNSAYFGANAVQFTTAATAGTLAFQRGTPFYHSGRSLFRFQPNIVSTDARYFVGLSSLYQVSNPTNVDPASLTQIIGVAKLSTSANLFIIHNDGSGVCTTFDLGVNYPANSNLYIYDIKITSTFAGVFTGVTIRRTTISTGATISTDYVVPSNYPTVGINPALWITNNATAAANSLYYFGAIGYNTTI